MKTRFYWFALLASAALIAQANAGGHHGGGGRGGGGHAPARAGGFSSFHGAPARSFGGGRMMSPGRHFSPGGMRQFNPGSIDRGGRVGRLGNNPRFAQGRNGFGPRNGSVANQRSGRGQVHPGRNLPRNWQNHVVARHSGNWHRDWDRGRDHWWHGHRCRFVNGSWVIFDLGFYPWSYGYPYGYGYYPYGYGSGYYDYDPGYYDSGGYGDEEYYDQNAYDSSVTTAQQRLARQGYYRGEIDGVLGVETRRGIARYQRDHGLRATGHLTPGTLAALGLHRVASY